MLLQPQHQFEDQLLGQPRVEPFCNTRTELCALVLLYPESLALDRQHDLLRREVLRKLFRDAQRRLCRPRRADIALMERVMLFNSRRDPIMITTKPTPPKPDPKFGELIKGWKLPKRTN